MIFFVILRLRPILLSITNLIRFFYPQFLWTVRRAQLVSNAIYYSHARPGIPTITFPPSDSIELSVLLQLLSEKKVENIIPDSKK